MRGEIVFLGTSSGVPTKERSHSAVFFRYFGDRFLFDCGEGTQRQLMKANKSPMKIGHLFISHLHGDHVLGLPGILQSMDFQGREEPFHIYGPKGTKEFVELVRTIEGCDVNFDTPVKKASGIVLETEDYLVKAFPLKHSIETAGYVFQEKDRKHLDQKKLSEKGVPGGPLRSKLKRGETIEWKGKKLKPEEFVTEERGFKLVYATDTVPCDSVIENGFRADILIHDATFAQDAADLATENNHSTARQAGEIARKANVKTLVLTHYSARYKDDELDKLRRDAKKEFDNVLLARDFERIEIP